MRHGTAFILRCYGLKCATRVCIGKRVKKRDAPVELLLHFGLTGNWKRDDAKFFGRSVGVGVLCS
jgi:hypothetical protein